MKVFFTPILVLGALISTSSAYAQLSGSLTYEVVKNDLNISQPTTNLVGVSSGAGTGQTTSNSIKIRWEASLTYTDDESTLPTSVFVGYTIGSGARAAVSLEGSYPKYGGGHGTGGVQSALADKSLSRQTGPVNDSTSDGPYSVTLTKAATIAQGSWIAKGKDTYEYVLTLETDRHSTSAHVDPMPGSPIPSRQSGGRLSAPKRSRSKAQPNSATPVEVASGSTSQYGSDITVSGS